jgi:disulfide bond formation protein DsbB
MSTETLTTLFALLTFLCAGAVLVSVAIVLVARLSAADSIWAVLRDALGDFSLWFAWLVALTTTLGSLYYSIGAHYTPCELCWYQRICVYPLSVVLLVAALRKDRAIAWYAGIPALVGLVIAIYHTQLQAFPEQKSFCDLTNPCTNRYVWKYGFVSLPLMDLVAIVFIITMLVVWTTSSPCTEETETE